MAQFVEKPRPAVQFVLSFSKVWFFGIIHRNYQKDSFKIEVSKNFKNVAYSEKNIGGPPTNRGG